MVNKPPKTSVTSKTAVFPSWNMEISWGFLFVCFGSFCFVLFLKVIINLKQPTKKKSQQKFWGSICHMFLSGSHSVMWRAHSRTYSILVSGKHFMKVPVLGKRTRGSWHRNTSASGAGQHLQVLVSLKFMAKPSPRAGPTRDPWATLRTGKPPLQAVDRRERFYFPFFGNFTL